MRKSEETRSNEPPEERKPRPGHSSTEPVIVVEYDPSWPDRFEQERQALERLAGAVPIEHIGSTAVPGLAAKPIIDIMLGLEQLADAEAMKPKLEAIGYRYMPEYEVQMPYRRFYIKEKAGRRVVHLHVVEISHEFWPRHITFRDHLRTHPESAAQYAALKRSLAEQYRHDRDAYTEAKTDFIRERE